MNTVDILNTTASLIRLVRLNRPKVAHNAVGTRIPRSLVLTAALVALCGLALTGSIASANPESAAPVIVAAEPTPDVHDPPIDDAIPAPSPSPSPSPEPLDDKAPPPSPSPSPSPDPIDDIIPAPHDDPVQVGSVELMKVTCSVGTNPDTLLDILAMTCLDDGDGYTFHLYTGNQEFAQDTIKHDNSHKGFASWDDVPVGNGTLAEDLPAGFAAPVVYCKTTLANGADSPFALMPDTGDAAVDFSLAAGDIFSCLWYNIPIDTGADFGTLTIYKYLCDSEVHTEGNCVPANAEFRLTSATGEGDPMLFAVGDDGVWSMDLPDGAFWELTEMYADPCWIQSADFTEGGTLPTTAGHETIVEVFNCIGTPDDDPGDEPTEPDYPEITQFPNTGSGPMPTDTDLTTQTTIALVLAGLTILGAGFHRSITRKEAAL